MPATRRWESLWAWTFRNRKSPFRCFAPWIRIAGEPALAEEVRAFVRSHGGVEAAVAGMDKLIGEAVFCLEALPQSEEKSYLATIARYVGERTF